MGAQEEVEVLNEIERQAEMLSRMLDRIARRPAGDVEPRWFSIARTDLQTGFMALRRSVTKDKGF